MSVLKSARACLGQVKAYQPGKPLEELEREYGIKNAVKMASNENALGPSARVLRAIRANLGAIHRYPDGGCHALRGRLSRHLGVKPAQLIFGNGSDEVLVFAVRAFVERSDEVIVADPSFLIYEIASQVEGARVVKVPAVDFRYDLDAMARRITSKTKLIFIANPDNPIGTYVNAGQLKNFLKKVPEHIAVVVDEAYYEFARSHKDYPDSLKLLRSFSNLIITRTFSKVYGMGGLRIGYAIAREPVITVLQKVREPFNINSLA
ncbi:MAG: histidinol-phosphate transaminase, partial [Candidatus Omnitrophota bacterium]